MYETKCWVMGVNLQHIKYELSIFYGAIIKVLQELDYGMY